LSAHPPLVILMTEPRVLEHDNTRLIDMLRTSRRETLYFIECPASIGRVELR
jgi:hypothetical protein